MGKEWSIFTQRNGEHIGAAGARKKNKKNTRVEAEQLTVQRVERHPNSDTFTFTFSLSLFSSQSFLYVYIFPTGI
jgi:hypothetical protein